MVLGNVGLHHCAPPEVVFASRAYKALISGASFDFECTMTKDDKSACDTLALARTPSDYWNAYKKLLRFSPGPVRLKMKFKYDFGPGDITCDEFPRIEPGDEGKCLTMMKNEYFMKSYHKHTYCIR